MAPWRKCVLGCDEGTTLFSFPKEEALRRAWMEFVYGKQPHEQYPNIKLFICARHFTEDCFENRSYVESGLVSRLMLTPGAVPTVRNKDDEGEDKPRVLTSDTLTMFPSRTSRTVACQTDSTRITQSVGTQLSPKTFQNHFRSKAIQVGRSSKRPFDEDEDKEEDSDEDTLNKKTKQSENGSDSALTEKTGSHSPVHVCNAANFIVYEDCLLELFNVCPKCDEPSDVRASRHGSMLSVLQQCPRCQYTRMWSSQPKA